MDKLKLIPHGSARTYGLLWDTLQLVLGLFQSALLDPMLFVYGVGQPFVAAAGLRRGVRHCAGTKPGGRYKA